MYHTPSLGMSLDACISITWGNGRGLGPGILEFLGPVKRERDDRRVPFGAQKTREFQGPAFQGFFTFKHTYAQRAFFCKDNPKIIFEYGTGWLFLGGEDTAPPQKKYLPLPRPPTGSPLKIYKAMRTRGFLFSVR
jgi:hypothetical protein